ncbi:hypothetical protein EVAR_52232_1 [Eumeta japonica]|uniref:Uncharacterized protein n=1 Tax=Eumeta variegata TaxID=151549 RepID=A0A4C1Z109_EUMVA|nr:hypothetical protein EVAR_52232_1 [Eumeta japonica]
MRRWGVSIESEPLRQLINGLCSLGEYFLCNSNASRVQYRLRKARVGRLSTVAEYHLRTRSTVVERAWSLEWLLRLLAQGQGTSWGRPIEEQVIKACSRSFHVVVLHRQRKTDDISVRKLSIWCCLRPGVARRARARASTRRPS